MMKKGFRLLLILAVVLPLAANALSAQDIQLRKYVMGNGGVVGDVNSDGIKIGATVGQVAIGKVYNEGVEDGIEAYQGFWTYATYDLLTDVEDNPNPPFVSSLENYPNPASDQTTFSFTLPDAAFVTLNVYDQNGSLVKTVYTGQFGEGQQTIEWNLRNSMGTDLASGSYITELIVEPVAGASIKPFSMRSMLVVVR